jgi:hypothetical protein
MRQSEVINGKPVSGREEIFKPVKLEELKSRIQ